jgi:hypothetical protein
MFAVAASCYLLSSVAHAEDSQDMISDQKATNISTSCAQLKVRLSTIQSTDTVLRINRGRLYDSQVSDQMAAFNSRVVNNKVNAPLLISSAADFQAGFKALQESFKTYTDDLTTAKGLDCSNNPREFYGWINKARIDRASVNAATTNLDQLLDKYIQELSNLKDRIQVK